MTTLKFDKYRYVPYPVSARRMASENLFSGLKKKKSKGKFWDKMNGLGQA